MQVPNPMNEVLALMSSEDALFDFNHLAPVPVFDSDPLTWREWRIRNWGTDQNPLDISINSDAIAFDTAWEPPIPTMLNLSKAFAKLHFFHSYFEEHDNFSGGGHYFAGMQLSGVRISPNQLKAIYSVNIKACGTESA